MIYAPAPWLRMSLRSFVIINSASRSRLPTFSLDEKYVRLLLFDLNAPRSFALIVSCNWRMLSRGTSANGISLKDLVHTCALCTSQRTCYISAPSGCTSYTSSVRYYTCVTIRALLFLMKLSIFHKFCIEFWKYNLEEI